MFTKRYLEYIASDEWRERKKEIVEDRGYHCEGCGRGDVVLDLHHVTYDRLGDELDEDLELLCRACHKKADGDRRYEAAMETYVRKKYGGYWPDGVEEEFAEWLEDKQQEEDW